MHRRKTNSALGVSATGPERALSAIHEGRYVHAVFRESVTYEPPPKDAVFVAVCNDKYGPGLEALVLSMLKVYPDFANRFVVYHDGGLSDLAQARLLDLYPRFEFLRESTEKYTIAFSDEHYNHRRVGALGYLTLGALGFAEPSWVIILDSDLIILGDISPLWSNDRIKVVPDIGERPYASICRTTNRPVINSGVIALPRSARGPQAVARAERVLATVNECDDPDIAHFADQKFWNLFLATEDVELLPQNYNCIKTLVERHYPAELGAVKILHVTGPKPWYAFINSELLDDEDLRRLKKGEKEYSATWALWQSLYLGGIARARISSFRASEGKNLDAVRGKLRGGTVALIGNGPSLSETDMGAFDGLEKVAFNWFINHDDFDDIRPDHLVIASHMLFGGWHIPRPELPRAYLDALLAKRHRPQLWISYYFKPYIETLSELRPYSVNYFLFEKPLKQRLDHTGVPGLDLYGPLVDSHTGVLTVGVPLALHLGANRIVLVGCDSNYTSPRGSYFYAAEKHASLTTNPDSLDRTWAPDGPGRFGFEVVRDALTERGVDLVDATIGGTLSMLPKVSLDEVRRFGAKGSGTEALAR